MDAELEEQVLAAKGGDADAFARLVGEFQDTAVGIAYRWLGDRQLALDAGQEAFADAYRRIGQLDDPRAFPGWLRSIVVKHCDRITRRRSHRAVPLEDVGELADPRVRVDEAVVDASEARSVRDAIETLPLSQRSVVALYYLARLTQPQIASLLELPVSTVEHRLRAARRRLRKELEAMSERAPDDLRPSKDGRFTDTVRLFLAVRASDAETVARVANRRPELLEAEEDWDRSLAEEGLVPFPMRGTPLIRAVERGDERMVRTLLELGASPDGRCGCATGESPLWTAVVFGHRDLAAELLDRGASPDAASTAGVGALHVAAMRGDRSIAELLLAHGADPEHRDGGGRTPGDWAAIKGYRELFDLLGGGGAEGARREKPSRDDILETGIKAVDLFVPLPRGAVVRQMPGFGVGQVVLLLELTARLVRRPRTSVVWCGFEQRPYDRRDVSAELREAGLADRVPVMIAEDEEETLPSTVEIARRRALKGEDVVLIVLEAVGRAAAVEAILPAFGDFGDGSVSGVVVGPLRGEEALESDRAPYRGRIVFDPARAERGLYPAVSHRSQSVACDETADRARELLESSSGSHRGELLHAYLSQPFEIAEPFTSVPGVWVQRERTLREVATILDGRADEFEPSKLIPNDPV